MEAFEDNKMSIWTVSVGETKLGVGLVAIVVMVVVVLFVLLAVLTMIAAVVETEVALLMWALLFTIVSVTVVMVVLTG